MFLAAPILCCDILFIIIDTSDYSSTSGEVTITEDSPMQCVSIQIRSDSYTESEQCFTFDVSSSSSVTGLTVSPSETEICIIDTNGEH